MEILAIYAAICDSVSSFDVWSTQVHLNIFKSIICTYILVSLPENLKHYNCENDSFNFNWCSIATFWWANIIGFLVS